MLQAVFWDYPELTNPDQLRQSKIKRYGLYVMIKKLW